VVRISSLQSIEKMPILLAIPKTTTDVIGVKTDPLKDVRALENVAFVMKGGFVYKQL